MPDEKAILTVTVKNPKDGKEVTLKTILPAGVVKTASQDELQGHLQEDLKSLALEPQFAITQFQSVYSMVDLYDPFKFGDTLVEINLPYCLHLPQGFHVNIKERDEIKARVEFVKVWTDLAAGSSEADYYTENTVTYFQNGAITSPKMPHVPSSGWDIVCSAKNAEKIMDKNGIFRYTILRVFLKTQTANIPHEKKKFDTLNESIQKDCRRIINKILDTYQFTTKEAHVERLPNLTITNIYFQNINQGYYPMPINIGSAMMNRSEEEIEQVRNLLSSGANPPTHERLFLSARNSFHNQDGLLVVVQAYQALEVYLENILTQALKNKGIAEAVIEKKLDQKWKTKDRLKEVLKEATGKSLQEIDQAIWDKWCGLYNRCRNEVIHNAKEIDIEEAAEALTTNEKVVALIEAELCATIAQ